MYMIREVDSNDYANIHIQPGRNRERYIHIKKRQMHENRVYMNTKMDVYMDTEMDVID